MTDLSEGELRSITSVLAEAGATPVETLTATLLSAGRSNLTYVLSDGERRWVLRTPPRTGRTPSAHDVVREFSVTRALAETGVPVARAVAASEEPNALGAPYAIWAFVDGVTIQSATDLASLSDDETEDVVDVLVATLAELHRVDSAEVGLEVHGDPLRYLVRQVRRWSAQWAIVGADLDASLDRDARAAFGRLGDGLPRQQSSAIVHGDYRIDNTLLHRVDGRYDVAAVVDWEMSTVGDPVADVALMCVNRHPAFDLVLGFEAAWTSDRLPPVPDLAARYERFGGAHLVDWEFQLALANVKIAVIAAGIEHRRRAAPVSGAECGTAARAVGPFLHEALQLLP